MSHEEIRGLMDEDDLMRWYEVGVEAGREARDWGRWRQVYASDWCGEPVGSRESYLDGFAEGIRGGELKGAKE